LAVPSASNRRRISAWPRASAAFNGGSSNLRSSVEAGASPIASASASASARRSMMSRCRRMLAIGYSVKGAARRRR
jgi:hypothetical protein